MRNPIVAVDGLPNRHCYRDRYICGWYESRIWKIRDGWIVDNHIRSGDGSDEADQNQEPREYRDYLTNVVLATNISTGICAHLATRLRSINLG